MFFCVLFLSNDNITTYASSLRATLGVPSIVWSKEAGCNAGMWWIVQVNFLIMLFDELMFLH